MLKTNLESGIDGDTNDISERKNAFGSNAYPIKKGRDFWRFLWESWQDLTLVILIIAAVLSLALGVIRGGRREKISIFDIVVGDVVPLKIGDRVPANGILISGHSICIDESSMTGESNLVHKDKKISIFNVWCKIADGAETMLVTGVGINTEWGLLMASISEDTDEETPLQVCLNGVASFIGIVGLSVAFAVLLVLLVRWPLWFLQFQKDFLWL